MIGQATAKLCDDDGIVHKTTAPTIIIGADQRGECDAT
jgi:hypothetical protein